MIKYFIREIVSIIKEIGSIIKVIIDFWKYEVPKLGTPKCYICGEYDDIENLKVVESHILVCGYDGEFHQVYKYHEECIRKAMNLEEGHYSHSKCDKAIEILDSLKMWEKKKVEAVDYMNQKRL